MHECLSCCRWLPHQNPVATSIDAALYDFSMQRSADALHAAQAIERVLDTTGVTTPRLLHGKDGTAWPML